MVTGPGIPDITSPGSSLCSCAASLRSTGRRLEFRSLDGSPVFASVANLEIHSLQISNINKYQISVGCCEAEDFQVLRSKSVGPVDLLMAW